MITIVGLGNPGDAYTNTRHNVGWLVLEQCMRTHALPSFVKSSAYSAQISEGVLAGKEISILFPLTFMNNSGVSVSKRIGRNGKSREVIVVHDDVDLPFGTVRVGVARGAGGHNGVESITTELGTNDFVRVRIGVGKKNIFGVVRRPQGDALADFVLGAFSARERREIEDTIAPKVDQALLYIVTEGVEKAMQIINAEQV